jgi:Transposase domain (DUF772)
MARDFVSCQRGQMLLMPPSLGEWLPEDHLVWTVLGAVEEMDLERFNEAYRLGAAGRPAYDPAMMIALLLHAYARGNRSSRGIERACWEDVAFNTSTGKTELRNPQSVARRDRWWGKDRELSRRVEDVLQKRETASAPILQQFVGRWPLNRDDRATIAQFAAIHTV